MILTLFLYSTFCKNSFIRVGEYYIFPNSESLNHLSSQHVGETSFTVTLFISESLNPKICFTVSLCRVIFRHLNDSDNEVFDPNLSNFLVITAPNSIIGVLRDISPKDISPTEKDMILKQWEKYHYVKDTSLVSVMIGSRIQKFPRKCVFRLIPSMYSNENNNLPFTSLEDSIYLNPHQYYENIYKHILNSSNSLSLCSDQPSDPFNKAVNLCEIIMLILFGKIRLPKKQPPIEFHESYESPQKDKKRSHSSTSLSSPPKATKRIKIIGKPVENKPDITSIPTPKSFVSEEKQNYDDFSDDNLKQWLEYDAEIRDPHSLNTPCSFTDNPMLNGDKKNDTLILESNIKDLNNKVNKINLLGKVDYETWICPDYYKALRIPNKDINIKLHYKPSSSAPGKIKSKSQTNIVLPIKPSLYKDELPLKLNFNDSDDEVDDDFQKLEFSDPGSENCVSLSRETSINSSNSTMVHQLISNSYIDSAKTSLALQSINYLDSNSNVFIPNFASIQYNNNVWLHNDILYSMNPTSPMSPSSLERGSARDSLFEIIKQEALNSFSSITSFNEMTLTNNSEDNQIRGLEYWRLIQSKHLQRSMSLTPMSHNSSENDVNTIHYTLAFWTSLMSIYGYEISIEDWLKRSNVNNSLYDPNHKISTWGGSLESMYYPSWPNQSDISNVDWYYALKMNTHQCIQNLFKGNLKGPLMMSEYTSLLQDEQESKNENPVVFLETFTQPKAIVGYNDVHRNIIEISTNSLYLWEKLDLKPYSPSKDILYFVISPESEGVKFYFEQLSSMYHLCNLGTHKQHESLNEIINVNKVETSKVNLRSSLGGSSSTLLNTIYHTEETLDKLDKSSIYKLTEDIKNGYKEACLKLVKAMQEHLKDFFDKYIVIYIVNPYIQEHMSPPFIGSSLNSYYPVGKGLSQSQQIESQISYTLLMQQCASDLKPLTDKGHVTILHGIHLSRVTSPFAPSNHFKETAFNIFNKCRLVSSLSHTKSDYKTKLYEPLFIISSSIPKPIHDIKSFFLEGQKLFKDEVNQEEYERIKQKDENVLHIAYSLSNGYMNVCCADSHGELLETMVVPNPIQSKEICIVLNQIYVHAARIVQNSMKVGKIVFGKFGHLTVEEVKEWKQIINDAMLSKKTDFLKQITLVSLTLTSDFKVLPQVVEEFKTNKTTDINENKRYVFSFNSLLLLFTII